MMRFCLLRSFTSAAFFGVLAASWKIDGAWGQVGPPCCNSKRPDETVPALLPAGREIFEMASIPVVIAITVLILAIGFWVIFQRPRETKRLISIPLPPERRPSDLEPFPSVPIVVAVKTPTTRVEELELL